MSIVAQSSAFTSNSFHTKPLFSSQSAFKKPHQGLTPNKSSTKSTPSHKKLHETSFMAELKGEVPQGASTDGEADIIFMEPVKKLKSVPEDNVQLFQNQPPKSTKLTIEDVFNKGAKKENGEGIEEEEEEDCSLSFISSEESLEDAEEKLVELKNDEQVVDGSQEETQEDTPEKEDKVVPEAEKNEKEAEEEEHQEKDVEPKEAEHREKPVLSQVNQVNESTLKSLYSYDKAPMSMNPMSYMSDMKDLRAFNTQYNAMLNNMYQNNPYMSYQQYSTTMQQQYQMLQNLQREQYSSYETNYNSYMNNEMLMAYNLSLNNNVYNNFTHYPRSETNYYMPYQQAVNPQEYSHKYNINSFQQLHPQYAEQQRFQQQNFQNLQQQRAVNFLDERRVKTSVFEEYADENESYTTTCAAESVSRDPAESSDGNKSQKVYSPLIVENKEVHARSDITGFKRPLIEEIAKTKKTIKPKNVKEGKNLDSASKKKKGSDLKQDLNPGYLKVERRLNKLQLLRYQQGDFEGNEALYNNLVTFNESLDAQKNQLKDTPVEDVEQVEDLRADLPPFSSETDSQRGRKVKMVWTPEIMSQEELSTYIQKLGEVVQTPMINQQGAIRLLSSCNLEVQKALETASLDLESYKEYFRLKVEKKRGRRPAGFVENAF